MVDAVLRAAGPYPLRLMARDRDVDGALPAGRWASAQQRPDGRVVVRAPYELAVAKARFMLALDDDTTRVPRRFARDPLIGPAGSGSGGYGRAAGDRRPRASSARSAGQLIEASPRARDRALDHPRRRRGPADARGARAALAGPS